MQKQTTTELKLIFERCTLNLNLVLFNPADSLLTLYIDQFFYPSDEELPSTYKNLTIGYIPDSNPPLQSPLSKFFTSLINEKVIYRALNGTSDNFFYILHETFTNEPKTLLIQCPFSSLFPEVSYLHSLSETHAPEILSQYNYTNWHENYKKSLSQWINFSASQKIKLLSLNQDLQTLSNKEPATAKSPSPLKSFGDCLLCYERSRNIVFLPCGHLVSCLQCAVCRLKVEITEDPPTSLVRPNCPICKQAIQSAIEALT